MFFAAVAGIAFGICIASTLFILLDQAADQRADRPRPQRHL